MADIEQLVEQFEPEEPLIKASRKLGKLHEYADKLAYAAHHHPGVMYENSADIIGEEYVDEDELSESEAYADMIVLSFFLSDAWQEAQEYFMFDFREEFYHFLEYEEPENAEPEKEAFTELNQKYDELEEAVQELDRAVSMSMEDMQIQPGESYRMQPAGAQLLAD